MKKALSFVLALVFALTAFGVTGVLSGIVAGAVSYDYYAYTQFPGYSAFTDAELATITERYKPDLANGHKDTTLGIDNMVTWDLVSMTNQWKVVGIAPFYPVNIQDGNHQNDGDISDWAAYDVPGNKTFFGETNLTGFDGISMCIYVNGAPYAGNARITLHQAPAKGPYYNGNTDGGDEEYSEYMGSQPIGFRYSSRDQKADEDGYFHWTFKTDFKNTDWWSTDDDGVNRTIYGDADGDGIKNGDDYYWPIPKKALAVCNMFSIIISAGPQVGDKISVGDIRGYKDSRVHFDELEEYLDVFDALKPEAYTEESYNDLMDIYLAAYDIYLDPDRATGKYSQDDIDAAADALRKGIAALLPMFKTKDTNVNIAGFDVLTDDDMDEINDGGFSFDAAMLSDDEIPNSAINQSVCIIGGAFDGPPSYDWSCFATAKYDDDDNVVAVNNVFAGDDMSETQGIRFWFKYGESFEDRSSPAIIGVGDSENGVYFECDESEVQLPDGESGYVGVCWDSFYDTEGDEEIFDHISTLDYFVIKIGSCAQKEFYISDLHAFQWSLQAADFTKMDQAIVSGTNYLAGLDKDLYAVLSWQHVEEAIAYAQSLHTTYAVTQEEADAAADEIDACIRRLCLIGDTATESQMKAFRAAYNSALDYWRGNYTSQSYANLRIALQQAEPYVNDVIKSDFCVELTDKLNNAIAELIPVTYSSLVNTVLSPEAMTSRQLSKAAGHRSDDTTFSLDKTYGKLPSGYSQALKMQANSERTSDDRLPGTTMWTIGAIQFKLMQANGGYPIINDIENPNIPGDKIGACMGDLTGSAGLRMWISVNDKSLFEGCALRFGISNCTEGPLFELFTCDIPFPVTGSGWIYIPWEYFEFYDSSWSSSTLNLKEIRYWFIKVNGTVKANGTLYMTGISAYVDPKGGANETPSVLNITNGQTVDISATDGKMVPDWTTGSAVLNGEYFGYGSAIEDNGDYELVVTNGDKQTKVNFTVTGGKEVSYSMPIILGVEEGGEYEESVTITWDVGSATLDGNNFVSGGKVAEAGEHTLVVTNGDKVATVHFTVKEKETPPAVIKGDFDGDGAITVADALAALRIGARLVEETPEAIAIGDTDNDGHVTVADALAILRVAAKLADSL